MKNNKILIVTITTIFLFFQSCKKDENELIEKNEKQLATVTNEMMKSISTIAKFSPEFRKTVEVECLKQESGDYTVRLDKLLEIDATQNIIPQKYKNGFQKLVTELKQFNNHIPNLFIPKMEKIDSILNQERLSSKLIITSNSIDKVKSNNDGSGPTDIIMVDGSDGGGGNWGGGYNGGGSQCSAPYYYPGFIIDDNGNLNYYDCISESMAYSNDVWVLGYEETVSIENQTSNIDGLSINPKSNSTRQDGDNEYGAYIQITDCNKVEPWIRGKFELKYFVYNSTGTLIKERPFGKIKRSTFYNQNWVNLRSFIGNWNLSSWGSATTERWIEENGGNNTNISTTVSGTVNGINYSTVIGIPARSRDLDMGVNTIQFTDQPLMTPILSHLWTKYDYYYMNMYRRPSSY